MTKKLTELFNLPDLPSDPELNQDTNEAMITIQENQELIAQVNDAIDKIDIALPTVRDLETSDTELDELADLAKGKFEDLMDLGMNMDPRFGGVVFQTAGVLLGHAITAKTAKMDKKLKMVQLQLQKARLDHQMAKTEGDTDKPIEGQGIVLDRNALLDQILQKNKST
ncbi:hypothetical protein UFOVP257_38 [uncultured Caudovirales phage]|uniref:Uncharacterized protein n=1 Tax=uncultured Caudovirales phage TaxID=2100421 RepID=A0A6J5LEE8_9CAUD|nr:hypothetical protein UFOVP257_38 [uncultured Caudovirales phage]